MIRNSMNTYTTPSIADATQRALKQMKKRVCHYPMSRVVVCLLLVAHVR